MTDTRYAAFAKTGGRRPRYPFASFPHADAARAWLANHPDKPVTFVPPLPDVCASCGADVTNDAGAWLDAGTSHPHTCPDDTLGPCGCTDYHLADCPTRTGGSAGADWYAILGRQLRDADDYGDDGYAYPGYDV